MRKKTLGRLCGLRDFRRISLWLLFAVLLVALGSGAAEAAIIKSIQRGTATFSSGQNTLPVTLTAVDTTKTIVWGGINWGGGRDAAANPNATRVGFDLASTTTLNLQRLGSPTNLTEVEWEAVEFASGVSVKRGVASIGSATSTVNVTIPSVTLSESFVLTSVATSGGPQNADEEWTVRAQLTSSTNLELTRNQTGSSITVYWQVISITGASVQRGLTTIGAGSSSVTAAISSVNTAASFLIFTQRAAAASNGAEAEYQVRGRITSSTQLTFDRISTANSAEIAWEVITLSDGSAVQSGSIAVGSATASATATLSSVNLSKSASFISVRGGSGSTTSQLDETAFTHNLTNSTTLTVTRGGTGTAADVGWFVIQFVGNQAPVLAAIGGKSTNENQLLSFRVSATDPDPTTPLLSAAGLPSGATFTDSLNGAGSFIWTPSFTQSGTYNVAFIASDGLLADSEVVTVTVNNVNGVPVLAAIGAKSTDENQLLSFRVSATDPDATVPSLSAISAPSGAVFTDSLNGAGSFIWTPSFTQSGSYPVTFIASDGSLADSEVVTITVNNVNRPPILDPIGSKITDENQLLSFRVSATDPDGTAPTLSALSPPSGAVFTDSLNGAGSFIWTPSFTQSGSYPVTFIASDGSLADSEVVTITVNNVNAPPVLAAIGAKNVNENQLLSFRISATDVDGTTPVLSAAGTPAGAAFVDSLNGAASFSWTPSFTESGSYPVTFIASDGSLADSEVVTITVNNVNRAPVLAAIGAKSTNENQFLEFGFSATDADGNTPSLSAVSSPSGATFTDSLNGAGSFIWTPTFFQSGTYNVTFIASDGSLADSEVVTITVNNVNRAPVLAAIGAKITNENQLLSFRISATDPDATIPLLSAVGSPSGATFTDSLNGAGSLIWTPSFTQAGTYNVTFIASDGSLADSEVVAITVNNVDASPVLASIGAKNVNENQLLSFRVSATDADGTIPTLSAVGSPSGAAFTDSLNGAGSFIWTPSFTQSGSYPVTFIASDGSLADSEVVTITANNVNRAPVLAAIGAKSTNENQLLSFRVSATDPDANIPSLSVVGSPSGATFTDSLNGAGSFTWTPSFTQAGTYNVTFIASDGSLADSEVVTITVNNVNRAPVLAAIGAKITNENQLLSFRVSATDPDATIPLLSAVGSPSGATFTDSLNGAGSFIWTPTFTQSGSYPVTFIASDGSLADSEVVTITVNNVNRAPVLAAIGAKNVNENQLLSFRVSATDPDATIPLLSAVGSPSGATFTDSLNGAGSFIWTPSFTQAGTYNVMFIASDGSLADSEVVTITVNNVNRVPVLAAIGAKFTNENQLLSFRVSATDPDANIPSLSVVGSPSGATFTDSLNGAGSFTWTPSFTQAGTYNVTFIASDGSLADSEVVTITVNNVNRAPVLAAIGAKITNENQLLSFRVSATDPDATIPLLSAVGSPSGATFTDSLNGAGSFIWTPTFTQSGSYPVTFIASDGSLADSEVVTITVNNVNRVPVLAAIGAKSTNENQLLSFRVSATDPDATVPSLSAVGSPSGATFTDSLNGAGSFIWTPTFFQSGTYNVTFIANDGSLADSEVVTITVNNVNRVPVLAAIGAKFTNENQLLSFRVSATDPDANIPSLSAVGSPSGATFTDSLNGAGSFIWTPSFTQSGSYPVTFIASDGSLADSEVVTITVNNVNRAPVLAAIGAKSTNENQLLSFRVSATDLDATIPLLSAVGSPSGAVFTDSLNGAGSFIWTPSFTQSGSYPVTFIASDGSLADSEVVTITVNNVNQAPILAAIGAKSTNENQLLSFRISATDPDATIPSLSAVGSPSGAAFTDSLNGAGSFRWTPSFAQAGTYNVTFIASDGSLADSEVVTITVNNVNRVPVLAAIGNRSIVEGNNLAFNISATDPDLTTPVLSASPVPSGATFVDSLNGHGRFSWTPGFTQSGTYNVLFIASDGSLADSEAVTITVFDAGNQAPVLASIGSKSVAEGQNLTFGFSANDPDATIPAFILQNVPSNATFTDSGNGRGSFVFNPDFFQAGTYNVRFIATDGSLTDSEVVAITVTNVNRKPVWAAIGNKTVNENQLLAFNVSATDPDNTIPSLSATPLPSGATFVDSLNGRGRLSWTPSFTQAGVYNLKFLASDGQLVDTQNVTITVNDVGNQAPVLAAIGAKSTNENQLLQFRVSATDPESDPLTLTTVGAPSGAVFVDSLNGAGSFRWTPSFTQSGTYNVTFIASDASLADSEVVTITVNNVNRAPVLAAIGNKSVNENQLLQFRISATDPDATIPSLSAVGSPSGAAFTDSLNGAGSFSWTPSFTQAGTYNVTFIASDGSLADSEVVTITVNNVNRAPVLAAIGAKSTNENQLLQFRISATDPDGTTPALSAVGLPGGATFTDSLNGAGSFSWTPSFTQAGTYNVTFIASDGFLADSEIVTITVNNVNRVPVLAAIGAKSTNENQLLSFRVSAFDPDATIPLLSAISAPSGAVFTDSLNGAGSFIWTPSFTQSGSYPVTFIASDGSLADSEMVTITVNNVNRVPVLAAIGAKSTNENQLLSFRVSASDLDATIPLLSAVGSPSGATFTDSLNGAGSFIWTPSFTQSGSYPVTFIASDGALADSEIVTITVNNVNRAPVLAAIGSKSTNENQLLSFRVSATDPDATIPSLTAVGSPSGATFTDSLNGAGSFIWTPSFTQSSSYPVTFIASDGSLADSEVVTITVNNANAPPVLATIGAKTVTENQLLQFRVSASDVDGTIPTLSAINRPSGASFVDSLNGAGSFSWTPSFAQAGTYNVTFIASDGSLADSEVVTITVNESGNQAPVLAAIGAKSTNENQLLAFNISASDADLTIPSLSAVGSPSGAVFVDSLNGRGRFTWTPTFFQSGTHNVTFIASDGSLADSEVVIITVNNVNRAPVLAVIGAKSTNENQLLGFRVSATDPDATIPLLSAVGSPTGATFTDSLNGAGSFIWTPSFTQSGSYPVTFIASDGSLADSEVVTITVNNVNRVPVLATIGAKNVNENQLLEFRVFATDPDATIPSLSAVGSPSGSVFTDSLNGAGSFIWTPSFFQSGPYNVTFIASDGSLADSEVVTITVNNVNRDPVLAGIGPKSTNENQFLQFRISAADPDLTIPSLSAVNPPSGAIFTDSLNGAGSFRWTPNFFQSGTYNVTFIATDGALADSEVVTITVNNVNRAPILAGIGNKVVNENQPLAFNISASDPDATIPVLTASALPSGATFVDSLNGRGRFTWMPSYTQSGAYNITFISSDGSLADSEVIVVSVNNVNAPPVLATIGSKTVTENQLLSFRISASDVDGNIPSLLAVGTPSGATFVDSLNGAGSFRWTPSFTQSGTYNVTFIASDGVVADSEVVTVTVLDSGNQAPVLAAIGAKSTNENQLLAFNISATDADLTTPSLSAVGAPSGATFVDSLNGRGRFSWTPTFLQSGTYNVTFIASDGSLADSEVVTITVNNVNRAPVLDPIGSKSTNENQALQFRVSSSDPDLTTPTLSAVGTPSGAAFVDSLNGASSFSWTPSFTQAGTYNATFIASDGSLADSEVVTITVNNVNRAPVLAAIGSKTVNENQLLQFRISATDPDATIPSLSAVGSPSGAAFVDSLNGAGSFRWTPSFTQSGVYNVTFIASDGSLADSEVVTITVNESGNQAPVLDPIGPKTIAENSLLQFRITSSDADGTTPALSAVGVPSGATFVDSLNSRGSFRWTPSFTQAGTYFVTFIASDAFLADSEVVTITVPNVNRAPVLATIGNRSIFEGNTLAFNTSSSDADNDPLTMTVINPPLNATYVDSGNGHARFSFSPNFTQSGNYNLVFIASDGNLADSENVLITVFEVGNQAPVLASIGSKTVAEGQNLTFGFSATDPDGTSPAFVLQNVPINAFYVDSGNGRGSFTFNPSFFQAGTYNVRFIATDGSLTDSELVAITVTNVNRKPVWAAIGNKIVNEGQLLAFNVSASDPDSTIPVLSAAPLPSGATFVDSLNSRGRFSWTPTFTQSGTYNLRFLASDGQLVDTQNVTITVNEGGNQAPVLAAIGSKSTNEGQLLQFRVSASDPDLTTPSLAAVNAPSGATFTDSLNGAGAFNWTPSFFQAGNYSVTFIASDGLLADSEVVNINVSNVNRAPILAAIGSKNTNENQLLEFRISAADPDLNNPFLSAVSVPLGATFLDSLNGAGSFSWTPSFTQAGIYSVTFIATDGTLADSEAVTISVTNVNRAPVLAAIGAKSVNENQALQFRLSANDPDLTAPALSIVGQPSGATFVDSLNGAGSFSWVPTFFQSGTYNVTFIASDGSLADSEVVTITVNNVDRAPVLAAIGNKNVNENQLLQFRISSSDPDLTVPSLSAVGVPSGATFSDSLNGAGAFVWTPSFFQSGTYNLTFIASDGSLADSEAVTITVGNSNQAPVLAVIGAKSTSENQLLQFRLSASDPDLTTPSFSIVGSPSGATFVDSLNGAGSFNWTPSFTQAGTYNVTFIASDGSLADSEVVTITVNNTNRAPVLAAIGDRSVNENQLLQFRISATDPDLSIPSFSAVGIPAGAVLTDSLNGAGSFRWVPNFFSSGAYPVTFIASDGALADSEAITITVNNVNRAPILAGIGNKVINENQLLAFSVNATDPDLTFPTLSTSAVPSGAVFVDSLDGVGRFSWTPSFTQSGNYNVTFITSDGSLADSEIVIITVNNVNAPPILVAIGSKSVSENQLLAFRVSASDVDGNIPSLTAVGTPSGATFVDSTNGAGSLRWTPSFTQAGTYNVTFISSDGSLADSEVVTITVFDAGNQAPVLAAIGAKSSNENQLLRFRISAADPDLTVPALSAVGIPSSASFFDSTNGAGSFSWTPDFVQAGSYNVTFIASDGQLADSEVVTITVNNVNAAPVLAAIGSKSTTEGQLLQFRISAADVDATFPVLSAVSPPSGSVVVDSTNAAGSFIWTPSFIQAGNYNVTFIASDGSLADSEVVAITVLDAGNQPPVLVPIGAKSTNENQLLAFNISAADPELTTPSLSTVGLPTGATFVDSLNGRGRFAWTPSFTQAGVYNVTFIASDGLQADSEVVTITVNDVNRAPVLAAIGSKTTMETQLLSFRVSASDPDLTNPSLSAVGSPAGAIFTDSLNGAGAFAWTPDLTQAGSYNVTFIASDGSLADSEIVSITVNNFNQAPVLASIGVQSITENQLLQFRVSATDADLTVPALSAVNSPSGAAFVDSLNGAGSFSWTPNFAQGGPHTVTFIASDGNLADSEAVVITVTVFNRAPVLLPIGLGPKQTSEGQQLSFIVSASDSNATIPQLSALGLPAGATFVDSLNGRGLFRWLPTFLQAGIYSVTFIASDAGSASTVAAAGLSDSEVVTITVQESGNQAPVFDSVASPITLREGDSLFLRIHAVDPEGDIPILGIASRPANSGFSDSLNGSGLFVFRPTYLQAGNYSVTFIATDRNSTPASSFKTIGFVVQDVNRPPILDSLTNKTVLAGQTLRFRVHAKDTTDATPGAIFLTTSSLPANAMFVDSGNTSGSFTFSPTFAQVGSYPITFFATDSDTPALTSSRSITVAVQNTNRAPVWITTFGAQLVREGDSLRLTVRAADPDSTLLTLTSGALPLNASFVDNRDNTATFRFLPIFIQAGLYSVKFFASDGLASIQQTVFIQVTEAGNQRPTVYAPDSLEVTETGILIFPVSGTDPDSTFPHLSVANLPANATFADSGRGVGTFVFQPGYIQSGLYLLQFVASDGSLADTTVTKVNVLDIGNQRPVLDSIPTPRIIGEGDSVKFTVTSSDLDTTKSFLLARPLPSNATFTDLRNDSGKFVFRPGFLQAGIYNIWFVAVDTRDAALADSQRVEITVFNNNRAPFFDVFPSSRTINEGETLRVFVHATDPDLTIPIVAMLPVAPADAPGSLTSILDGTGGINVTYVPSFNAAGSSPARILPKWTFSATDRDDGSVVINQQLQVTVVNVEKNPILTAIGAKATPEGTNLTFDVTAADPDSTAVTLLAQSLPSGAAFTPVSAGRSRFSWTPAFNQAGNYQVLFIARDITLRADSELVTITVSEFGNHPPVLLVPNPDTLVLTGNSLFMEMTATDADLTTPTLSALSIPRNATFLDRGNGTGRFDFVPDPTQIDSTYIVTFRASDGIATFNQAVRMRVRLCLYGDLDRDELLTSTDVVRMLNFVFLLQNPPLYPDCSVDLNDDGLFTSNDVVHELNLVFLGIAPPKLPPPLNPSSNAAVR